jgi:hypothetical protein
VDHGFLRAPDGTFTTCDPPNAVSYNGSNAGSIRLSGAVAGYYRTNQHHGFLRSSHGTFTAFDPPGSTNTLVASIHRSGMIAGVFFTDANANHGFLRASDGSFTPFDVPGQRGCGGGGASSSSVNAAGATTGVYFDSNIVAHGFVRASEGTIVTFAVPGAGTQCCSSE